MTSSGIPFDTGALMATVLEGVLYGFSVLMFMGTMWSLTYKQHVRDINRPIAIVAILLFLLSTAHIVVSIIRVEDGLVKYRDTYPGGPAAFFADVAQETYVIKHALYVLQTLLADGMVVYRCYVVWQSIWVIILPGLLWCSVAVTGTIAVYSVSQSESTTSVFSKNLATYIMAYFVSTMAANLSGSGKLISASTVQKLRMCPGLMAYRIWAIERNITTARAGTRGTLMPIVRLLVDAAILYSLALVTALICFLCSNNGEFVMVDLLMPIISITFYMVLIRIAMNKHRGYLSTSTGRTTVRTEQSNLQDYPMTPVETRISKFTHGGNTSVDGMGSEHKSGQSPTWILAE